MSSKTIKLQAPATVFSHYQAYLLRLWQETPQAPWRVSLQAAGADERLGFASLEDLVAFLEGQTDQPEHRLNK